MLTEEKTDQYALDSVMIGRRIKSARKEKKSTQEELSAKCHCTATHISNIENGKIGISLELLYILGIVLEKSLDYFIMDTIAAHHTLIQRLIAPPRVFCKPTFTKWS